MSVRKEIPNDETLLRAMFTHIDSDEDGYITIQELKTGLERYQVDIDRVKKIFADLDANRDGWVTLPEFMQGMKRVGRQETIHAKFIEFDKDKSGYITFAEARDGVAASGIKVTDAEVEDVIQRADKNGDGKLSYEEFVASF